MVRNWQKFGIFRADPDLDPEPLQTKEELDNYFVELDSEEIRSQIFDLKGSKEGLRSFFGRRILILGEYKVGKTTLKNYIINMVQKSFKVADVTLNVANIMNQTDVNAIQMDLYTQWYSALCRKYNQPRQKCDDHYALIEQIIKLYEDLQKRGLWEYSIVVFDQANKLEKIEEVKPFKTFCETFQGVWEQFPKTIKSKLTIFCIGNRTWTTLFNLGKNESFGVFTHWMQYGNEWSPSKIREALEKRIKFALKPEHLAKISFIVTDKLETKLRLAHDTEIFNWLKALGDFLSEFSDRFEEYEKDFKNFDRFLDDEFIYGDEVGQLVRENRTRELFLELAKLYKKIGEKQFKEVAKLISVLWKEGDYAKSNLQGLLNKRGIAVDLKFIMDELCLGPNDERPEMYYQPPFKITSDNQKIRIRNSLHNFMDSAEEKFKKDPMELIILYLKEQGKPEIHHVNDREINNLKKVETILSEFDARAVSRKNADLHESITKIQKNLGEVIYAWDKLISGKDQGQEALDDSSSASVSSAFLGDIRKEGKGDPKRDAQYRKIKKSIQQIITDVIEYTCELYDLGGSNDSEEQFLELIKMIGLPGDKFDYAFYTTVNPGSTDNVKETINYFFDFMERLNNTLTLFEKESPVKQNEIIRAIKNKTKLGILWVVDGPNSHSLDVSKAFSYINEQIKIMPQEPVDRWVIFPKFYSEKKHEFHPVHTRFKEAGFEIILSNKGKDTDIDAEWIQNLRNDAEHSSAAYRCIIISCADRLIIQEILNINSKKLADDWYIILDESLKFSYNKFIEAFGVQMYEERVRFFSINHRKVSEGIYEGIMEITQPPPPPGEKRKEKRMFVSYAENGKSMNYVVDQTTLLSMEREAFNNLPKSRFIIRFTIEPGSTVVKLIQKLTEVERI